MSYVAYTNLKTPNEVIASMEDYVRSQNYPMVQALADDLNIYDRSSSDGKKFVFMDMEENYFISLRSANEVNIFGTTDDATMDITEPLTGKEYKGIGLTIGEGYSSTQRWYSQYNAPVNHRGNVVQCGWMPVSSGIEDIPEVTEPEPVPEPEPVLEPSPPEYPDGPTEPTRPTNPNISLRIYHREDSPATELGIPAIILDDSLTNYFGTDDVAFLFTLGGSTYKYNHAMPFARQVSLHRNTDASLVGDSNVSCEQMANTYPVSRIGVLVANTQTTDEVVYYQTYIPSSYESTYLTECSINPTTGASPGVKQPAIGGANEWYFSTYLLPGEGGSGPAYQLPVCVMTRESWNRLQNYISLQEEYDDPDSPMWQQYNALYAQYEAARDAWSAQVEAMRQQYEQDTANYQAYLQALAAYEKYLRDLEAYRAYIELINRVQHKYTLFCNHLTVPTDTLTFSLVKIDLETKYYQTTHLVVGLLQKYDESWVGGIYFTGSATHEMVKTAYKVYKDDKSYVPGEDADSLLKSDKYILPIFSSSAKSNTFLRINIDEAPAESRGNILWACSGTDNVTGKRMSLPVRVVGVDSNGKIPHYQYLQSQTRLDWGRNINTLNCITINMPLYFSVNVDPDQLDLYAAVGVATGVFFVSTLNMQTGFCYEQSYPQSGDLCQVFPMGRRRGNYGFDGVSIRQRDDDGTIVEIIS